MNICVGISPIASDKKTIALTDSIGEVLILTIVQQ
jgi:hypothetical protein